jgi:glutathione S-transferase
MKATGITFEEKVIPLYEPGSKDEILTHSPAGKVPVLEDGGVTVWDSLAIIEYLAENEPEAGLWPKEPVRRAHARSVSAEMHSGFLALRREMPMNLRRAPKAIELSEDARADIARIDAIWGDCLQGASNPGPFLFGAFCAADAMFAPVVGRLWIYDVPVSPAARAYMDAVMALPAWGELMARARNEAWTVDRFEIA